MRVVLIKRNKRRGRGMEASAIQRGFSLAEVIIAMAILGVAIGAVMYGYTFSSRRAEWSAYSLAAQSLAMQRLEQTRACKWDLGAYPVVDELQNTNFPAQVNILDIPIVGTNIVYATNFTEIVNIQTNYPPIKLVTVQCIWSFVDRRAYTNSIASYRVPDALGE